MNAVQARVESVDPSKVDPSKEERWPRTHGEDALFALPKNPHTLYVYWELRLELIGLVQAHFGRRWSDLPKALRVFDVTGVWFDGTNAGGWLDVPVRGDADNWYAGDLPDGRDYVLDWGVYTDQGRFTPLLRSNCVHLPRSSASVSPEPGVIFRPLPAAPSDWMARFTGYSLEGECACSKDT